MICRELCRENLAACLEIEPRHLGNALVGSEQAFANWSELINRRSFNSIVVEDDTARGRRPIAFGASVFATTQFVDDELSEPRPGLESRLIASLSSPRPAILSDEEVTNANVSKPMDVIILGGSWLPQGITPEQVKQVQMLLPFNFVECHTGYPLHRILTETVTQFQHEFQMSAGVFRRIRSYPDGERALTMMNESSARSVSGSLAAKLFDYKAPVLGLRDTEKQLLSQALRGGDDVQIAARVHLAIPSVKKRWQSVFSQFENVLPDVLHEAGTARELNHRGTQKRHHVLTYVRQHPEELRPYRWMPETQG